MTSRDRPEAVTSGVRCVIMENGVRLLLRRKTSSPCVAVCAMFGGGVRLEKPENSGVVALMAEGMTWGSVDRPEKALKIEMDDRGIEMWRAVDYGWFGIGCRALSDELPKTVEVLADVIRHPAFPPGALERTKNQSASRFKRDVLSSYNSSDVRSREILFEGTPYALSKYGSLESVASIPREQLVDCHARFVRPRNLVISAVGDFDLDEAEALFRKHFEDFRDDAPFHPFWQEKVEVKGPDGPRCESLKHGRAGDAVVVLAFRGPAAGQIEDRAALIVLETTLGDYGYLGGRLVKMLRKEGMSYSPHFVDHAWPDAGRLDFNAECRDENALKVARIMWDCALRADEGLDEELVARCREIVLNHELRYLQRNDYQAFVLATNEAAGTGYDANERWISAIRRVDVEDLRRVARKYLKNPVLLISTGSGELDFAGFFP